MMWGLSKQLPFTWKENLSLFRVGVLIVAAEYEPGSQAGMWDLDPLEVHLFQQFPPALLLSPGNGNSRRLFPTPLPCLLQAAAPLALTSTPLLQRKGSKMNVPWKLLGPLLPTESLPETQREFILSAPDDENYSYALKMD